MVSPVGEWLNAKLAYFRNNMMLRWLLRPKVCKFVCVASSVVGLLCSALSSSLNILRKLIWLKILIYIVLSFFICSFLLFITARQRFIPLWLKAHLTFFALIASIIYTIVFETVVDVKPDAYSAISCASFAIMCLCLSRLTQLGFEIEFLYFFCGDLLVQLWKIEHWSVIIGGCFIYFLVLIPLLTPEEGLPVQDRSQVAVQSRSNSEVVNAGRDSTLNTPPPLPPPPENGDDDNTPLLGSAFLSDDRIVSLRALLSNSSSHEENLDRYLIRQLEDCIEEFEKKNESLVDMVCKHIEAMVDAESGDRDAMADADLVRVTQRLGIDMLSETVADANMVRDSLISGIDRLRKTVKQMIEVEGEEECCSAYSKWRGEFLEQCLLKLGLQLKSEEDAVKTWKAAGWILLLNERELCYSVFSESASVSFTKVCEALMFQTLSVAYSILRTGYSLQEDLSLKPIIPKISELLRYLRLMLHSHLSLRNMRFPDMFIEALDALGKIGDYSDQATVAGGGVHEITVQLTKIIEQFCTSSAALRSDVMLNSRVGGISLLITDSIERLERNLAAMSIDYKDPVLGYVFMMNNLRYIGDALISIEGIPELGDNWFRRNTEKVEQNCTLYQSHSSWNEIVKILKLEGGESMKLEWDESMKKRLKQRLKDFNREFYEICKLQSTWIIHSKQLREQIIKSIDDIMVLPYGLFINRFRDVFGNDKDASDCIRYGIVEIQNDISNLFLLGE